MMLIAVHRSRNSTKTPNWFDSLKRITGADWAIAYTVLARGFQIIRSTGTVLLIVRFLSPVGKGVLLHLTQPRRVANDLRIWVLVRDTPVCSA